VENLKGASVLYRCPNTGQSVQQYGHPVEVATWCSWLAGGALIGYMLIAYPSSEP